MPKIGIEFDEAAQKKLEIPLGKRELYPSVGKYVAEILREQGVSIAWGVPGGHIWHYVDAISRIGIKLIVFGHEQNAVYAAEGYTQVTRNPFMFQYRGTGYGKFLYAQQQAFLSNTLSFMGGGQNRNTTNYTTPFSICAEFFEHRKWSLFFPGQ